MVMEAGTPKDEMIPYANASATEDAVMLERNGDGPSGHAVDGS